MYDPRVEMQKTAFRTIFGMVMIFCFFLPPGIMFFGSGPVREPIWKLRLTEVESLGWTSAGRESVGRASPPASPGGLFSSDRSDKPGDRPTPIDLSAMIREQLLILLTASALWLALFGMPRSVTKTESTQ